MPRFVLCLLQIRVFRQSFSLNIKYRKQPNKTLWIVLSCRGTIVVKYTWAFMFLFHLPIQVMTKTTMDCFTDFSWMYLLVYHLAKLRCIPRTAKTKLVQNYLYLHHFNVFSYQHTGYESGRIFQASAFCVWNHAKRGIVRYKVWNKVWIYFSWNRILNWHWNKHLKLTNHNDLFSSRDSTGGLLCRNSSQVLWQWNLMLLRWFTNWILFSWSVTLSSWSLCSIVDPRTRNINSTYCFNKFLKNVRNVWV